MFKATCKLSDITFKYIFKNIFLTLSIYGLFKLRARSVKANL